MISPIRQIRNGIWVEARVRAGSFSAATVMAKPIPQGCHTITRRLVVKGAAEAIGFHEESFGAEEISRMPMPGRDVRMTLGHAALRIGDSSLYLADEFPEHGAVGPNGHSRVTIHRFVADADAAFDRAVAAGATVTMPLADMSRGDRHGKVVDPFGHHWSIATREEDLTPEEMHQRMMAGFGGSSRDPA